MISPHFDDAVFSCGHWLQRHPGTVVATVCSGNPGPGVPASEVWDTGSGFASADEATAVREAEDAAAVSTLGGERRLLGFLDFPYRSCSDGFEEDLERAIGDLLDELRPVCCLAPLGLVHPDHISTGRAARSALGGRPQCSAIAYAELPYAIADPSLVPERLAEIDATEQTGVAELQVALPPDGDLKRRAVACYRTQLGPLESLYPGWHQAALAVGSERFWRLSPAPRA